MSSILLPIIYPSKQYMFQAEPNFTEVLKEVVNLQNNSNLMFDMKIMNVNLNINVATEAYNGSVALDRTRDFSTNEMNSTWTLPNRAVVKSVDENIRTDFSSFVGEILNVSIHTAFALQLTNPTKIPDEKYNVYIMAFNQNFSNYNGLFEDTLSYHLDIPTNNILTLAASVPQVFHSKINPSKVKIGRIGYPLANDEYDPADIIKDIFTRESKDSVKLGNLNKLSFKGGEEFKQIASNVSRNDTIIIMNHNPAIKTSTLNHMNFDSIFYVPVGTTLNEYLAEEKIKKELIRMKMIEMITGKIN